MPTIPSGNAYLGCVMIAERISAGRVSLLYSQALCALVRVVSVD